ncbi:MAG: hypothetical protein R3C17_00210 [Planctomycetaceae bacterium]
MIRLLVGFMLIDVLALSHLHAADRSSAPLRMIHAVPDRVMNGKLERADGRIGADSIHILPHATADADCIIPYVSKQPWTNDAGGPSIAATINIRLASVKHLPE